MHESNLIIECKNPEMIKKSLEPDIKNDEVSTTEISTDENTIKIFVKSKKLNHMKAILNSYISLISTLLEVDSKVE